MPGSSERYNALGRSISTGVRRAFSSWTPSESGREVGGGPSATRGLGTRPGTSDAGCSGPDSDAPATIPSAPPGSSDEPGLSLPALSLVEGSKGSFPLQGTLLPGVAEARAENEDEEDHGAHTHLSATYDG